MRTITVSQKCDKVVLENHLGNKEPLLLVSKPFQGQREVAVHLPKGGAFSAVAWGKELKTGMFSHPEFFSCCSAIGQVELVIFEREGLFTLLLPLSPKGVASHIRGVSKDVVKVVATNSRLKKGAPSPCLVAVQGHNLEQAMQLVFNVALETTGGIGRPLAKKEELEPWMRRLGWGSGPAFSADVSHDQIVASVWSLRQRGFPSGFVLLEEGWQDVASFDGVDQGGAVLKSFDANRELFPLGLKGLVEELQRAGVERVGVWHPILGYRGGLHPDLARRFKISKGDLGHYLPGEDMGRSFEFYYAYYAHLAKSGISFVMAGDQCILDTFFPEPDERKKRYLNIHAAIQAASGVHFSSHPWNGECLKGENLYWWTTSNLARIGRGSGDEDWEQVQTTLLKHLYNAFWVKELMHPIGEPLTSTAPHSELLALFLALFGGPLILADPPGQHDVELLSKIVLANGEGALATGSLEPLLGSFFADPLQGKTLAAGKNRVGDLNVFGFFHLSKHPVPLEAAIKCDERLVIWSGRKGFVGLFEKGESCPVRLGQKEGDVFTLIPVEKGVALIGTKGLFLPGRGVMEARIGEEEMNFSMKVSGPVVLYSEDPALEVRKNGKAVPWDYDRKGRLLTIEPELKSSGIECSYHIVFDR